MGKHNLHETTFPENIEIDKRWYYVRLAINVTMQKIAI
jgi:hypothetical protein